MNFDSLKVSQIVFLNEMFAEDLNNGVKACEVSVTTDEKVWWRCQYGHTFLRRPSLLNRKQSCPRCERILRSKPVADNITITHPDKAKYFDLEKNYPLKPEYITHGSNRKVWWKCDNKSHEPYQSLVHLHINGKSYCPSCRLENIPDDRKLSVRFPDIAKEWNVELNDGLTADQVTYGSPRDSYWKCSTCGHDFKSPISARTSNGRGCPKCFRRNHREQMISHHRFDRKNSIVITHPNLLPLWNHEANGELKPSHVSENSNRQVTWTCSHCHTDFNEKPVRLIKTKSARTCPNCCKPLF